MKKSEIFALVDCNNFYAACERVFNPELRDKPIGILSNNDGIIVALSEELKQLGIKRGTPVFEIRKQIARHDIRIFSSNYTLYGDMSARVMKILTFFTPDLEIYSIDEAFLHLNGLRHLDLTAYGYKIRNSIRKWTGLPVSVGIGPTKTLAKIANRVAKKNGKLDGVFDITVRPDRDRILAGIDVKHVWGVGPQYANLLHRNGFHNVLQLAEAPQKWIKKKMTLVGLRTVLELRGISCIDLEQDIDPKKEIVSSKSFGIPVLSLQDLREALNSYCIRAVEKLREEKQVASQIMVYLTTNRFKEEPQYANFASCRLPLPSAYTPDFLRAAQTILSGIYRPGYKYKKVGVMLSDITHQSNLPPDLFAPSYLDDRRKKIMDCLDSINHRIGANCITYAGIGKARNWQMKREMLTPRYTTSWDDLPLVKA
ncbi:MAG: Y-family DNA polymerase [Candidatus Cloacimonetes bacterium]|nr:Y-family DNA polymerase [Candidatus Cloacimonadota bacterium]